jgi:hypothetical protein
VVQLYNDSNKYDHHGVTGNSKRKLIWDRKIRWELKGRKESQKICKVLCEYRNASTASKPYGIIVNTYFPIKWYSAEANSLCGFIFRASNSGHAAV